MNQIQWQDYCSQYFIDVKTEITSAHNHLSIYLDSIEAIHINALKISFPVVLQLLGDAFFIRLSREYIKNKNWQCDSLDNFGADFNHFLCKNKQVLSLNYLSEVAMIEWKIQSLTESANHNIDFESQLQKLMVSGEVFTVNLLPHVDIIKSNLGGMKIWLSHQQNLMAKNEFIDISNLKTSYWIIENSNSGIKVKQTDNNIFQITNVLNANKSVLDLCNELGAENVVQAILSLVQNNNVFFNTPKSEEVKNVS